MGQFQDQRKNNRIFPKNYKMLWGKKSLLTTTLALSVAFSGLIPTQTADALTRVSGDDGTVWEIHDSFAPNLDSGSLRKVSSTQAQGFGNIFVKVSTSPLMNGQMMRGFGLKYDGENTFYTTQSVNLGNVLITREIYFDSKNNRTRFFDSFTNVHSEEVTVDVSFGGSLGYGTTTNAAKVKATSTNDLVVSEKDTWMIVNSDVRNNRPVGVVTGSVSKLGNQQKDPFSTPLAITGNDANFYGFINTLTLKPGETKSLLNYVQVGATGEEGVALTAAELERLTATPDLTNLSSDQVCTIANWEVKVDETGDVLACEAITKLDVPPAPEKEEVTTAVAYDVTKKTIADMQKDLEAGKVTSEEITRAYLDRIKAYDLGQLGFHSFLHVSESAIEQAKAADAARKEGKTGELLGIPIAIKDIYDTKDMPTTGGTKALEGWQPRSDAYQVAKLREAGAVIIGKTNTSEFANSGSFSESGWAQTWNALYPSKTSFGSSGGSAVAVAANLSAAAMGSQTGVSLYAPTTGASLTTFRGTDGMSSTAGVMPLTWGQDYAGPIAKTVTDLAYLLNATTGMDEEDLFTVAAKADEKRPEDWTDSLDKDALKGKKIGFIPSSFVSSFADDDTGAAVMAKFSELEAAGATMVEMPKPPSGPKSPSGLNASYEGWGRYIDRHEGEGFPYKDGNELLASDDVLIYNKRAYREGARMTPEAIQAYIDYRNEYKEIIKAWMDEYEVDAVVYAGFISNVFNNDAEVSQLSSDRGTGVLTSNVGLPTVVVPVGTNSSGYSMSMQLVGRAWDDAKVLGMGYALEQQTKARIETMYAPRLKFVSNKFADIADHWAKSSIDQLIAKELILGYEDATYRPDKGLTRAEAVTVLMKAFAETETKANTFTDVAADHWALEYISKAANKGLITGYADGTFRPDQSITRAELSQIVVKAFELKGANAANFTDVNKDDWFYAAVDALFTNKVVIGYGDQTFKPESTITRAEFAQIVAKLVQ